MLLSISESIKFLIESFLTVLLFCSLFANMGVHLFRGQMRNRCLNFETGIVDMENLCGAESCPEGWGCFKWLYNAERPSNLYLYYYNIVITFFILLLKHSE